MMIHPNIVKKHLGEISEILSFKDYDKKKLKSEITCAYLLKISIEQKELFLIIGFDKGFPYSLPFYYLHPVDQIRLIPHVDNRGLICYTANDCIVDYRRPEKIIEDSLKLVEKVIYDGLNNINSSDFIDEIEDYWKNNKSSLDENFFSNIPRENEIRVINYQPISLSKARGKKGYIFGSNDEDIRLIQTQFWGRKQNTAKIRKAIFIPVSSSLELIPETYNNFFSLSQVKELVYSLINPDSYLKLLDILESWKCKNQKEYLVLGVQTNIGVKLLGIEIDNQEQLKHPLLNNDSHGVKPFVFSRMERKVLQARSGSTNYNNKKVLVVGCGSVGSKISFELMNFGIGDLSLIDHDTLFPENIYRHALGLESIYRPKVDEMKHRIESDYPHAKINNIKNKLESLLIDEKIKINEYDIIINATGSPNTSFFLNSYLLKNNIKTPVIYTWNEPYGIGGHSLLISDNFKSCYKCLYDGIENRASYCKPGQSFTKRIAGCSSSFIPFSSLDSLRTAILCMEQVAEVLSYDGEIKNTLLTWKGNSENYINEGLELSERYSSNVYRHFFRKNNKCDECI